MIISRTLSAENMVRFKEDFSFLNKVLDACHGEMDLALRDNYVNFYYRGHSLAKIEFKSDGCYDIVVHEKFWGALLRKDNERERFSPVFSQKDSSITVSIGQKLLYPLFQVSHLKKVFLAIKSVDHSEELVFEQDLITDNHDREDLLIIDRQVCDKDTRKRMDLLALKQVDGNQYRFVVLEVKMGNNPELAGDVAGQLQGYIDHIADPARFPDYKQCYEKQYEQKRELGLFQSPSHTQIEILEGVEGVVVVGRYTTAAKKAIDQLAKTHPQIKVQLFKNRL